MSQPGLDGLTRFTYQFSDESASRTVHIGLKNDRVFVLDCSAADAEAALHLLTEQLETES